MTTRIASAESASQFTQESLLTYSDAISGKAERREFVATMRIFNEDARPSLSATLFPEDAEVEAPKSESRGRTKTNWFSAEHILTLSAALEGHEDAYISQALFDRKQRRVANFSSTQTVFCDVDIYNHRLEVGHAVNQINALLEPTGIPESSISLVGSGRGLYVKLPLDKAVQKGDLVQWARVTDGLIRHLAPVGSDVKVRDCARVLRAPGSFNSKNGSMVQVLRQAKETLNLDRLDQLLADAGAYSPAAGTKARNIRSRHASELGQERSLIVPADAATLEEKSWSTGFAPFRLDKFHAAVALANAAPRSMNLVSTIKRAQREFAWRALSDIDRVAELRGGQFSQGLRDASVFWSLVLLSRAQLVTPENFWTEAFALAARTVGGYNPLMDGSLGTLFSKLCQYTATGQDTVYVATKDRLMNEICISSDEEKLMSVLCTDRERKRRDRLAQKAVLSMPGMEGVRNNTREFAAKLVRHIQQEKIRATNERREARISIDDLANKFKVTHRTMRRYMESPEFGMAQACGGTAA